MTGLRLGNGHPLTGLSMLIGGTLKPVREVPARHNHMPNPSFETGTTGTAATRCTISSTTDHAWVGSKSLKIVAAGTGATYVAWAGIPATPGLEYTSTFRVFALPGIGYVNHNIAFYDSAGTMIIPELSTGYRQVNHNDWVIRTHQATAPPGAVTMRVLVNVRNDSNTNPAAGATAYVDAMYLGLPGDYFDGDTPDAGDYTYSWDGAPGASTSTAKP